MGGCFGLDLGKSIHTPRMVSGRTVPSSIAVKRSSFLRAASSSSMLPACSATASVFLAAGRAIAPEA